MITYKGYEDLTEEFLSEVTDRVAKLLAICEPKSGDIIRFPDGHLSTLYINNGMQQVANLNVSRYQSTVGIGVSGGVLDFSAPEIAIGTDIVSMLRITPDRKDMTTWTFTNVPESFYFMRPYRVWDIDMSASDKSSEEEQLINPPTDGWKEKCHYVVEVSFAKNNPVHRDIFYTGFLQKGVPAGYNTFLHATDTAYHDVYSIRVVSEIGRLGK